MLWTDIHPSFSITTPPMRGRMKEDWRTVYSVRERKTNNKKMTERPFLGFWITVASSPVLCLWWVCVFVSAALALSLQCFWN